MWRRLDEDTAGVKLRLFQVVCAPLDRDVLGVLRNLLTVAVEGYRGLRVTGDVESKAVVVQFDHGSQFDHTSRNYKWKMY